MKAPKPNSTSSSLPPAPLPPASSSSSQKQKSLSIHIATDHIGPSNMPLVYGSTPERVGSIRGTVRFSTNYPCKGKDIVIMYEAKAEAQWSGNTKKKDLVEFYFPHSLVITKKKKMWNVVSRFCYGVFVN
jgi:hypothetical protein